MKRKLTLLFQLAGVAAFGLESLPDGKWAGMGHFSNEQGIQGGYTETLEIKSNVMRTEIQAGGKTGRFVITYTFTKNGFFTASIEDQVQAKTTPGTGYCGSVWCHVGSEDHAFEMTYAFIDDKVYELGSALECDKGECARGWFESELAKAKE